MSFLWSLLGGVCQQLCQVPYRVLSGLCATGSSAACARPYSRHASALQVRMLDVIPRRACPARVGGDRTALSVHSRVSAGRLAVPGLAVCSRRTVVPNVRRCVDWTGTLGTRRLWPSTPVQSLSAVHRVLQLRGTVRDRMPGRRVASRARVPYTYRAQSSTCIRLARSRRVDESGYFVAAYTPAREPAYRMPHKDRAQRLILPPLHSRRKPPLGGPVGLFETQSLL